MNNSVRKAYNNDQKTASVVNSLRHPDNRNKLIILVEGDDDVLCYGNIMNSVSTKLIPVGGCTSLECVINNLNSKYCIRLLAIRDADFKRANQESRLYANIFWTDFHDIEMMQLCGGGAMHECDKYCYGCYKSTVMDDIQKELINVSYVRWFNQVRHDQFGQVGICFDYVPICSTIYDAKSVIVLSHYWTYLEDKQTFALSCNTSDVSKFISTHSTGVDLKQITNGHEAISALWCKINVYYKQNLSKKQLAKEIRDNYTIDAFKNSILYKEIQSWRKQNNIQLNVFKR